MKTIIITINVADDYYDEGFNAANRAAHGIDEDLLELGRMDHDQRYNVYLSTKEE